MFDKMEKENIIENKPVSLLSELHERFVASISMPPSTGLSKVTEK